MSSSNVDDVMLTLVSQEGDTFRVPLKVCMQSEMLKGMIDTTDASAADEDIPITDVKSAVLAKVIEFMEHHTESKLPEIEKPIRSTNLAELVPEWDANFVNNCEMEMLFELILAANFLDIKPLLDLTCAKVATIVKGKTAPEIRRIFNIVNDFTPEEEAAIIEENKWCEEA